MKKPKDEFERKRALRQKKIRRRRVLIGMLVFLAVSAAIFLLLSVTVLFPVKNVTAEASSRYSSEMIIEAGGLSEDDNIFTFSASEVKERIRRALPYAGEITVSRSLPYTVDILIENELEDFACIAEDGVYYAVSEDWKVLNCYTQRPEDLFTVNCSGVSCTVGEQAVFSEEKTGDALKSLIDAIVRNGIKLNGISAEENGTFTAAVSDRFTVKFGTAAEAERKVAHLAGMLRSIEPDKTGRIDLSMWTASESEGTFVAGAVDLTDITDPQSSKK